MKKKINLEVSSVRGQIKILCFFKDVLFCEYVFDYFKDSTPRGETLNKATMLSWATLDLMQSDLTIISALDTASVRYITNHYRYIASTYNAQYGIVPGKLFFESEELEDFSVIGLNKDAVFLGLTGGKDSTLSFDIVKDCNLNITAYKVTYDDDTASTDGHIYLNILDKSIYNEISITGFKESRNFVSSSQADDIHVTFSAPFIDVVSGFPAGVVAGLPWECIKSLHSQRGELVPTETAISLKILTELFTDLNITEFKFYSPLAGLHTFAIYHIIFLKYGMEYLLSLESCWNFYHLNKECGFCPKCQRLKYIFKKVFNYDYLNFVSLINTENSDFLFGSLHGGDAIVKLGEKLKSTLFVDNETCSLSKDFFEYLQNSFQLSVFNEAYNLNTVKFSDGWEPIQEQVYRLIGVDYRNLSDELVHNEKVPQLPFEFGYGYIRKNKLLNCVRSIPIYNGKNQKWELIKISSADAKDNLLSIESESLDLFKRWLDKEIILHNYPNLKRFCGS